MIYFTKHQYPDVPVKCMEILFSTSNIYPSLVVGVVDGLKMDELFFSRQPLPSAPTLAATTAAGTHLASIATTMSSAVTRLTSKAAANHADANQDETIDYKTCLPIFEHNML